MKRVNCVGLGYVGLPTALLAAQAGFYVTGVDVNEERINAINDGALVINEPDFSTTLKSVLEKNHFVATTQCTPADYFVIAVPTPFNEQTKKADMSYVTQAAMQVADVLQKGNTVILESTVAVGATAALIQVLEKESGLKEGHDFFVAYCPERILPGNIFHELKVNDRVIGALSPTSVQYAAEFYKYFVSGDLYLTDLASAEMVKLIENSYRDVNIAFAHQVAAMAQEQNIDPYRLIELANKHPRVSILQPSAGVGGHCIAVDPWFLVETFKEKATLLEHARKVNDARPLTIVQDIQKTVAQFTAHYKRTPHVALLGLSYKANADDLRESPAVIIAEKLVKTELAQWSCVEPCIEKDHLPESLKKYTSSLEDALKTADIVVPLVAHDAFKQALSLIKQSYVIDVCGLLHSAYHEVTEQEQFFWAAHKTDEKYSFLQGQVPFLKEEQV